MNPKPTYEELEKRIQELENEVLIRAGEEEVLRRSEKRYRSLVETSSDWLWEVDVKGRYTYASSRGREILGYEPEEVVGRTPFDLMPEEEARRVRAIFVEIQAARRPFALIENVNQHRDGRLVVLETSGVPVFDSDGEFTGYRGMDRDITERKQAGEALKESERKFRAIFDQTFQFMGLLAVDGPLIEVNRNALQFAGVQESKVVGEPFWRTPWWTHSGEQQDRLRAAIEKAAAGEFVRFESTHFSADGNLHHMDFSLKPVRDEASDIAFLIAEARDISDRKRMEQLLRESKAYLDAAIESIPFEFWCIGSNGRYTMQNRTFRENYGDIIGKKPEDICPSESLLSVWRENNRLAFAGEMVSGEIKYFTGNKERSFYSVVVPIRDADKIIGILGINVDITDRKLLEEELRKVNEGLESKVEKRTKELHAKTRRLEELNAALNILIKQREQDKRDLEENIFSNLSSLIVPYIDKLKRSRLSTDQMTYVNILESHIQAITAPFAKVLSGKYFGLTPIEVQTAGLIKEGKAIREIAESLCVSDNTVKSHRFHIRKKLGLTNKKINLRTYLQSRYE